MSNKPLETSEREKIDKIIFNNKDVLLNIAKRFALSNPKNIADLHDYYQEACLALIEAWRNYNPEIGPWANYFTTCVYNELSRCASVWNSPLSVNQNVVRLAIEIFRLESEGVLRDEILTQLKITNKRYLEAKSILSRGILYDDFVTENKTDLYLLKEIREGLSEENQQIFDMCLEEMSIAAMAQRLGWSAEWMRVKVHKMFDVIRKRYDKQRDH